jgi:hypothetical protein
MDAQEKRIAKILGVNCKDCDEYDEDEECEECEALQVHEETAVKYMNYLSQALKFPCHLKVIEAFPWEDEFLFGHNPNKQKYEKLKKENPSYLDTFELIELLPGFEEENFDLLAHVTRISDNETFQIGLSWLEAINEKDSNHELLHDYSVWNINY